MIWGEDRVKSKEGVEGYRYISQLRERFNQGCKNLSQYPRIPYPYIYLKISFAHKNTDGRTNQPNLRKATLLKRDNTYIF